MRTLAVFLVFIAIAMLMFFDSNLPIAKKSQKQLDLLNGKISFFKVVLELVILLMCKNMI